MYCLAAKSIAKQYPRRPRALVRLFVLTNKRVCVLQRDIWLISSITIRIGIELRVYRRIVGHSLRLAGFDTDV